MTVRTSSLARRAEAAVFLAAMAAALGAGWGAAICFDRPTPAGLAGYTILVVGTGAALAFAPGLVSRAVRVGTRHRAGSRPRSRPRR